MAAAGADGAVGTLDYGIDNLNAAFYCLGFTPGYCSMAHETLAPKNKVIVDTALAAIDPKTYRNIVRTVSAAYDGDSAALEAVGAFLISSIKKKPNAKILDGYLKNNPLNTHLNTNGYHNKLISEIQKYGYKVKATDSFSSDYKVALEEAFKKTGVPKSEFIITKWGKDKNGKSFPVEYRSKSGAEVNIDLGHTQGSMAPGIPHIGWQTAGKRGSGGAERGHIFVPNVPFNRSKTK